MTEFRSLALKIQDDRVLLLDQTALPHEERWIDATAPRDMIEAIYALRVRGAPLIGVAAAACLGALAQSRLSPADWRAAAAAIRAARPTAVNLMWAIDRLLACQPPGRDTLDVDAIVAEAEAIAAEDVALCEGMATHGAALIHDGEGIVTHCNTGGLATAGIGTALAVIRRAHEQGKKIHVFVDETRPLLQGGRLTAWELARLGVPCTLITDSMAALILRDGRAQRVLVGSDRVAANGDFANKVGTYGLAVQARYHGVPFHPVAPFSTVDLACPTGASIPVEDRRAEEVRGVRFTFGEVGWAPEVPVFNPAFDVTPVALVESLVLDSAVVSRVDLEAGRLPSILAQRG